MSHPHRTAAFFAAALGLLSGCVLSEVQPRNTGRTVDIRRLEKTDYLHETWLYRHPTIKPSEYSSFWVPPVNVYVNTPHVVEREPYDKLVERFTEEARARLAAAGTLADGPGPGIMRIQVSVVDIKPVVKMTDEGGNDTILYDPKSEGSKIEADCFDSVSDELIYTISTLYKGEEYNAHEDPGMIATLRTAFSEWSDFFSRLLKESREQAASQQPAAEPTPAP